MNMKLFNCIVDDGRNVFWTLTAVKNKKELLSVCGGNGTFVKIEDVTKEYFTDESPDKLADDLSRCGWGKGEVELIRALLEEHMSKVNR